MHAEGGLIDVIGVLAYLMVAKVGVELGEEPHARSLSRSSSKKGIGNFSFSILAFNSW